MHGIFNVRIFGLYGGLVFLIGLIFSLVTDSVYTYPTEIALVLNNIFMQGIVGGFTPL